MEPQSKSKISQAIREVNRVALIELNKVEGIEPWERPSLYRYIQRRAAEVVIFNPPEGMLDRMYPPLSEEEENRYFRWMREMGIPGVPYA